MATGLDHLVNHRFLFALSFIFIPSVRQQALDVLQKSLPSLLPSNNGSEDVCELSI